MHVKFADLVNSPNLLLSLPDRDGESYFASYPDTDETIIPYLFHRKNLWLWWHERGEDDVLVAEYEYQEFLVPALQHHCSVVRKDFIPIERDPYPTRKRHPTSFYSAKNVRSVCTVRLAQAYSANIPSLTKFLAVITDPRLVLQKW